MKLIGQYDSPFVRRVAVTLNHYGILFERKVVSVFTDFDEMLKLNPLGKVPVLELDDGELIFDSRMIIDYAERLVCEDSRLVPSDPESRRRVLRIEAVALGVAEKSYERGIEFARRHPDKIDRDWANRLERQLLSGLGWLEALQPDPWLYGDRMTQADVTCAIAFTYLREKQQIALASGDFPALDGHCDRCEGLPAFASAAYSSSEAARSGWSPKYS